jgi:MoaA/NifB/PqqE/SkfB family radical SAM enzyme
LTGGKIELIDLLGGEPLLHPELVNIVAIARKYFEGDINIVTNGVLLVKMPEAFWQSCHENNIGIIISGYPIKLKMSEIQKLADRSNVKLVIRGSTNDIKIWNKVPYDLSGKQNPVRNFRICYGANMCINLENGRLATCPIPFVIKQFNNYFHQNIPVLETDTIDIYKVKSIDEIFNFLRRPNTQCKYCNLDGIKYGVNWSVSKKELSEWV